MLNEFAPKCFRGCIDQQQTSLLKVDLVTLISPAILIPIKQPNS